MPKTYLFLLLLFAACQAIETPKPRVYYLPTLDDYIRASHQDPTDCCGDFLYRCWHKYDDKPNTTDFAIQRLGNISHIWGKHGHIRWLHRDFLLNLLKAGVVPVDTVHRKVPVCWTEKRYEPDAAFVRQDFIVYELRDSQDLWTGSLMGTPHAEALAAIVDAHHAHYAPILDPTKYRLELAKILQELQYTSSTRPSDYEVLQFSMNKTHWIYSWNGMRRCLTTYFNLNALDVEETGTLFSEPSFEHGYMAISSNFDFNRKEVEKTSVRIKSATSEREPTFVFFRDRVWESTDHPVHYFLLYYFDENYQLKDWKVMVYKSFLQTSWWRNDPGKIDLAKPH